MVTDRYQHVRHHPTLADFAAWARARGCPCWGSTTCRARSPSTRSRCRGAACCCSGRRGRGCRRRRGRSSEAVLAIRQFGSTRSINAAAASRRGDARVGAAPRCRGLVGRRVARAPRTARLSGEGGGSGSLRVTCRRWAETRSAAPRPWIVPRLRPATACNAERAAAALPYPAPPRFEARRAATGSRRRPARPRRRGRCGRPPRRRMPRSRRRARPTPRDRPLDVDGELGVDEQPVVPGHHGARRRCPSRRRRARAAAAWAPRPGTTPTRSRVQTDGRAGLAPAADGEAELERRGRSRSRAAAGSARPAARPAGVRVAGRVAVVTGIRHARAVMAGRPPALSVASSSSTVRPGRTTRLSTSTSATGTGPRISNVSRASSVPSRGEVLSSARPSSAAGGPACWLRGSQGPAVCSVERKRPPPSGS